MIVATLVAALAVAAPNPIQAENAQAGVEPALWLPPAVPPTRIEGWASELSVPPGEQVHLHVATQEGDRYRVELYRLGYYGGLGARLVGCTPSCSGDEAGRNFGPSANRARADWPITDTLTVPSDAVSGYYYALLRLTAGGDETGARAYVPFVVRAPAARRSTILVQVPVNTWQAYNPWGGKSLYGFNSTNFEPATRVSFDRPLAFTAQGPFDWEYNMVRFLEREGYDVAYQTDADTDAHPESLLEHRLVMVIGHDEYWTKRQRDAFEAARDAGTNLAFTNSNASYWQVRYEDGGRTLVGYKEQAPDPEPDPALKTIRFRDLSPPRPECSLLGVMFYRIRDHYSGPVDYTATDAASSDPWFAGTGFKPGDKVFDVVGNEWDSRPETPQPGCDQPNVMVLFHYEGAPQNADAVKYTAASGARVFAAGAQQWSYSLDTFNTGRLGRTLPPDSRLQQFTRNALADLTRPAEPVSVRVQVRKQTVRITLSVHFDPRVLRYEVFGHRGSAPFGLGDAAVTRVCATRGGACTLRRMRPGTYRFAAVAVDEWGRSTAALSAKVAVRRRR